MKTLKITEQLLECAKKEYNSFYLATLNFANKIHDTIGIKDCRFIDSGGGCYHFVILSKPNIVYVIHSESGKDGFHKFETFEAFRFGNYFQNLDDFFNDIDNGWEFGEIFSYDSFTPYSEELIKDFYERCEIHRQVKSIYEDEFEDISEYLGKDIINVLESEDGGKILFLSDGSFYLELDRSDYRSKELKPLLERLCAFSLNENMGYKFYPIFKFKTELKSEIKDDAKKLLEHTIDEIYIILHSKYNTLSGDETPEQRNKRDELTEELINEITEQVYQNI